MTKSSRGLLGLWRVDLGTRVKDTSSRRLLSKGLARIGWGSYSGRVDQQPSGSRSELGGLSSEVGEGLCLISDHSNIGRARSFRKSVRLKIWLKGRAPAFCAKRYLRLGIKLKLFVEELTYMWTRSKRRYYRNSARETREINQVDLKLLKFSRNSEITTNRRTYESHKLIC